MSAKPRFVHLRTHTDFSMIDGIAKVKPLVKACAADNMVALALTDFTNFCGVVRFTAKRFHQELSQLLVLMYMLKVSYVVRNYSRSLYLLRTIKVIKTSHYCFQKPINVAMWIYLILTRSG